MEHRFIADLQEGSQVAQYFLLRRVENRTDKTGKPYLALELGDKTGIIEARLWSEALARHPGAFTAGEFVGIRASVESYQGKRQLNVRKIVKVAELQAQGKEVPGFDPEILILATPHDRQELWRDLWELADANLRPPLKGLVLRLLEKYQVEFFDAPAARSYHHPYLGGLLEHTCFVARHALASLAVYPDLNPDLVVAGAILHDLGKLKELANPYAPERTVSGELLGHIVLGWKMVREEARALDFPDPDLLLQLEHIILSHHGSLEFGSPVPPKTREALLVYCLDDLDAKLKMMAHHLESDASEGYFTS
ncbi:MAG: HD domain-containing protein, partial [Deltaproteobacteria bacterium]|nr:HD domain-containing protein [Deltaproteobacteria bacterium]